jgi:hypothetical protein
VSCHPRDRHGQPVASAEAGNGYRAELGIVLKRFDQVAATGHFEQEFTDWPRAEVVQALGQAVETLITA